MRTLGSIIIIFAVTLFVIFTAGMRGAYFIDWSVLTAFVLIFVGVIIATTGFKTFISGINGVMSKKYQMTAQMRDKALSLFRLLQKSTFYTMVLITVLGVLGVLTSLDDISGLGPALFIALIGIVYGSFINLAFLCPAIYILEHKLDEETEKPAAKIKDRDKEAVEKLLQLCFEKGLSHEDIMAADEISLRKQSNA